MVERTVKKSIRKSIDRANLEYDELNTILIEIESITDARPITYVYNDEDSTSYTLTPSHVRGSPRKNRPLDLGQNSDFAQNLWTKQGLPGMWDKRK